MSKVKHKQNNKLKLKLKFKLKCNRLYYSVVRLKEWKITNAHQTQTIEVEILKIFKNIKLASAQALDVLYIKKSA